MGLFRHLLRGFVATTTSLFVMASSGWAASPTEQALAETIARLETDINARIGVYVLDTETDWRWGHRETERFLMASTFKSVLCGAVLDQVDRGQLSLDTDIPIRTEALQRYAPVAKTHVGGTLSIAELCLATLDLSDNTAANLLIEQLGGVGGVMDFLARVNDPVTRLDRMEPALNTFSHGDPRDTTSPSAMVGTWRAMLMDDGLSDTSKAQLYDWMSRGGVTGAFIRASAPSTWDIADKSGGGSHYTRNLVAMITPPDTAPYLVAIYVSDTPANWDTRNAAVQTIGAAIVDLIKAR
ncbi:MAG: class A beta-lactamase [Tateyamaria sp.]